MIPGSSIHEEEEGKSLEFCGLDLKTDCFAHGKLYAAYSKVDKPDNLYIYTDSGTTKNILYPQIKVPIEHYWGAQTQRSLENFKIGIEKIPESLIKGLAAEVVSKRRQTCSPPKRSNLHINDKDLCSNSNSSEFQRSVFYFSILTGVFNFLISPTWKTNFKDTLRGWKIPFSGYKKAPLWSQEYVLLIAKAGASLLVCDYNKYAVLNLK
uniref:Uncharacterized protein n=1 Tax=Onchocerca volvulus TaxID=6282 RepID=A0A8R1U180_ONCVO